MAQPFGATTLTPLQEVFLSRKGSYNNYFDRRKHYQKGTCPFCIKNGLDPNVNKVVYQTKHWAIWEAPASSRPESKQNGLYYHIMIVLKDDPEHKVETVLDLSRKQSNDLFNVWAILKRNYDYTFPGFMLLNRSGDPLLTGATEEHFCFQILVPDRTVPNRKRMAEVSIKTEAEEANNFARGRRFSTLYERGVTPEEFSKLVADGQYMKDGVKPHKKNA